MTRTRFVSKLTLAAGLVLACNGTSSVEHTPDPEQAEDHAELTKLAFDADTIQTMSGTVVSVEPFQRMTGTRHGLRIRFKSQGEVYYVYLGPERYLDGQGLTLSPNDEAEVVGSVLDGDGRRVIIANEITSGAASVRLRDDEGRPVWRRWRRRSQT